MTTERSWASPWRRSNAPVVELQSRARTPIDLLAHTGARDDELSIAADQAMTFAETLLIVHSGDVRVSFDQRLIRGHVLATTARRHLTDPVLSEPFLDLTGEAAAGVPWLARWQPTSVVSLPLLADGRTYGTVLAVTYARACDSDDLRTLREFAERMALILALRDLHAQLRVTQVALDASAAATIGLDDSGRVQVWNAAAQQTYRIPAEDAVGRRLDELGVDQADASVSISSRVDGDLTGMSLSDRSGELHLAAALERQRELSEMLLASVPGRACVLDRHGIVVTTNTAFDKQGPLGRGRRSTLPPGSDYLAWLQGVDNELRDRLLEVLRGRKAAICQELVTTYRRRERWTELHATGGGRPDAAALILHIDITERKETELDLEHRATHDPLTGLPNRVLLVDRLTHALTRAARSRFNVGILYCDLDGFKEVNTRFGHAGGDQLLVEMARRLKVLCRNSDTVSRVAGDEFVLLLEDVSGPQEMEEVAQRVLESLSEPVELEDGVAHTGASIGMVLTPGIPRAGMGSVQKLVRQVDAAMYAAKDAGKNAYAWFSPEMLDKPQDRPNFLEAVARRLLNR